MYKTKMTSVFHKVYGSSIALKVWMIPTNSIISITCFYLNALNVKKGLFLYKDVIKQPQVAHSYNNCGNFGWKVKTVLFGPLYILLTSTSIVTLKLWWATSVVCISFARTARRIAPSSWISTSRAIFLGLRPLAVPILVGQITRETRSGRNRLVSFARCLACETGWWRRSEKQRRAGSNAPSRPPAFRQRTRLFTEPWKN